MKEPCGDCGLPVESADMHDITACHHEWRCRADHAEARVGALEAALRPFVPGQCCETFVASCVYCVARSALEGNAS